MIGPELVRQSMSRAARRTLKLVAHGADRLNRPDPGITILIYHQVRVDGSSQITLSASEFDRQLRWLASECRVLDLDSACDELDGDGPVEPGVVLTFDDGTSDWTREVLPRLDLLGLPATFYITSGFIDGVVAMPAAGQPATWDELRELNSSPLVTIGSHTHTHRLLRDLDADTTRLELDACDNRLSQELGIESRHFAYPKAIGGSHAAQMVVADRYRSAVVAGSKANRAGFGLHQLSRSPVQRCDSARDFEAKARGGMSTEDALRERVNRIRYRSAER